MNERQDTPTTDIGDMTGVLLETVRRFAAESHARSGGEIQVTLDSSFEKDLYLDSLGRVELLMRVERAFGISLPEQLLASAETPRDLLREILVAAPATATPINARLENTSRKFGIPNRARVSAKWWYSCGCGNGGSSASAIAMATANASNNLARHPQSSLIARSTIASDLAVLS